MTPFNLELSAPSESLLSRLRRRIARLIYPEGEERRARAERLANVDALTGIANRRALDLATSTAVADPTTLFLLFDANNFGLVNKRVGHSEGDSLLRELARTIERVASRYGFGGRVFRAGGDEFVVLASEQVAGFIREDVEQEFGSRGYDDFAVSVSGTIGGTFKEADATLQLRKEEAKA